MWSLYILIPKINQDSKETSITWSTVLTEGGKKLHGPDTKESIYYPQNINPNIIWNLAIYFPILPKKRWARSAGDARGSALPEDGKSWWGGKGSTFTSFRRLIIDSSLKLLCKTKPGKKKIYNGNTDHLYCNGNSSFIIVKNVKRT